MALILGATLTDESGRPTCVHRAQPLLVISYNLPSAEEQGTALATWDSQQQMSLHKPG